MWQDKYTNVLTYTAGCNTYFKSYCASVGYNGFTTFFGDLGTAEWYGLVSVKETYKNIVRDWLDNYKYFTEFVIALNVKSWYWYQKDDDLCRLYCELYYKAIDDFHEHYKENEEAERYFYLTTD